MLFLDCALWEFSPSFFLNKLAGYGHFVFMVLLCGQKAAESAVVTTTICLASLAAFHSSQSNRRRINRKKTNYILK